MAKCGVSSPSQLNRLKDGSLHLSRLSDAGIGWGLAAPHFVPTALVRGYYISGHEAPQPVLRTIILIVTKALARVYFYRHKDKRDIRNSSHKKYVPYVLINYPYVYTIGCNEITPYVRVKL